MDSGLDGILTFGLDGQPFLKSPLRGFRIIGTNDGRRTGVPNLGLLDGLSISILCCAELQAGEIGGEEISVDGRRLFVRKIEARVGRAGDLIFEGHKRVRNEYRNIRCGRLSLLQETRL